LLRACQRYFSQDLAQLRAASSARIASSSACDLAQDLATSARRIVFGSSAAIADVLSR
jgi:hypothetical protein